MEKSNEGKEKHEQRAGGLSWIEKILVDWSVVCEKVYKDMGLN